jgi:hypothetical protein
MAPHQCGVMAQRPGGVESRQHVAFAVEADMHPSTVIATEFGEHPKTVAEVVAGAAFSELLVLKFELVLDSLRCDKIWRILRRCDLVAAEKEVQSLGMRFRQAQHIAELFHRH